MAYSFTWLYAALIVVIILIIAATIMCFFAPSYLQPVPTSTSVTANNQTAQWMLYGAGVIGVIILLMLIGFGIYIYIYTRNVNDLSPVNVITESFFGWGVGLLVFFLFILVLVMLFFIIYAASLIDRTVNLVHTASGLAIGAGVIMAIVFIIMVIATIYYMFHSYNAYLTSLLVTQPIVAPVVTPVGPVVAPVIAPVAVQPKQISFADNTFTVTRNVLGQKDQFSGDLIANGTIKSIEPEYYKNERNEFVKNTSRPADRKINTSYTWVDGVATPVVAPVVVGVQPVVQPVLQPVQRRVIM